MTLAERLIDRALQRAPDFVIGGHERPYLRRWWLIPRNKLLNVYLHQFLRSDDDRALHSHPWLFNLSWLLRGQYREHTLKGSFDRKAGDRKFRWGASFHRIELFRAAWAVGQSAPGPFGPELPCWTLFITGPRIREWHFLCPQGLVHWRDFTAPADKGSIGRGCE